MEQFLSCDWGTSTLRLKLVSINGAEVLIEEKSAMGIAFVHKRWIESAQPENEKVAFYLNFIQIHIKSIELKLNQILDGIKLFISGMASSSLGFIDISYSLVPFSVEGFSLSSKLIPAS